MFIHHDGVSRVVFSLPPSLSVVAVVCCDRLLHILIERHQLKDRTEQSHTVDTYKEKGTPTGTVRVASGNRERKKSTEVQVTELR